MIKDQENIINFLRASTNQSAASLAAHFAVSIRTIKSRIKQINQQYETPLILSSKKGYRLDDSSQRLPNNVEEQDLSSIDKRKQYITNRLIYSQAGLNKYDLSDELFTSLSTLEREITKINHEIDSYDLHINHAQDNLIITGSEENKRRWIAQSFYQEIGGNFFQTKQIQGQFSDYQISDIKEMIITTLEKYQLFVNAYTLNAILLHSVVVMDRIRNDYAMNTSNLDPQIEKRTEYQVALDIVDTLEKDYQLSFNRSEIYHLTILLIGKSTAVYNDIQQSTTHHYFEKEYFTLAQAIIKRVNEHFFLNIGGEDFFVKFALHIKNLTERIRLKQRVKNPMTVDIKQQYPLIYDLAVFVSNELEHQLHTAINEDEITYLALHLGSFLEYKKETEQKLTTTLVCLDYYDMHLEYANKIIKHFGHELTIQTVISDVDQLEREIHSDIIIGTVNFQTGTPYVKTTPFLNELDLSTIKTTITAIQRGQKKEKMVAILTKYVSPELFSRELHFDNEWTMIEQMAQKMIALDIVEPDFTQQVTKREQLSSTAFSNGLAMPHAIEMTAKKTAIYFVLNREPAKWGQEYVQTVVMIAISQKNKREFRKIFNSLIEVLSEKENIAILLESQDYDQFIENLLDLF